MSWNWEERERRHKAFIVSEGSSCRESSVHCPHCGEENENDEGQFSDDRDYDKWIKHSCGHCEKDFESCWEATYSTRKISEDTK